MTADQLEEAARDEIQRGNLHRYKETVSQIWPVRLKEIGSMWPKMETL